MKWFFVTFFTFSMIFLSIFGVNCAYGYVFPQRYQVEIQEASDVFDVDESLIYSLINTESHFNKNAISSKGAVGLMQVMPSTAEQMAEEIGMENYDLLNVQDNIFIGTYYLKKLIDKFGNLETALASYNAGPTNVNSWLKNENYSEDGKTLKDIPFNETKNYITRFQTNYKYYKTKIY